MSVIVPAYNRANFLPALFNSLFGQTYAPIEVIVVDDGSTDNTQEVVEEWIQQSRDGLSIQYFYQENQGAPVARNRGVEESSGEFIQFLDSDDLLHPQKLDVQVDALDRYPDADVVWGKHQFFQDGTFPNTPSYDKDKLFGAATIETLTHPGHASHPESALYRREAISRIGSWNENLERWQDWEYAFRVAAHQLTSIQLPETFYYLREHNAGKIGDRARSADATQICLRTLSAIDRVISEAEEPCPGLHEAAFRLYLSVLSHAFRTGENEHIKRCFRGARVHCTSATRRCRVEVLEGIYDLFGPRGARIIQEAYSMLKTGTRPAGIGR